MLWVYAIALALGCVQALDRPTAQAFLYELVGPDDLSKAVGLQSITQSAARMLGPALGSMAYALLGTAACFAINAVVPVRGRRAAADASGPTVAAPERCARARHPASTRRALCLSHPQLRAPVLVNVLIGCLAFNFMTTITAMVRFEFTGGPGALGAAHALNAAGAVAGSLLVASLARPPSRTTLALCCAAMALTICVNAVSPSLTAFLLWAPIFGLSIGAYQTALVSSVQRATEPRMLGRVSGLLVFGSVGTTPIGSLIVGWLIDTWSARAAMGVGAATCAIGALVLARPLSSVSVRLRPRLRN